jgi:hypothetical protein
MAIWPESATSPAELEHLVLDNAELASLYTGECLMSAALFQNGHHVEHSFFLTAGHWERHQRITRFDNYPGKMSGHIFHVQTVGIGQSNTIDKILI